MFFGEGGASVGRPVRGRVPEAWRAAAAVLEVLARWLRRHRRPGSGYQADEGRARRPVGAAEAAAELTLEEAFHGTTRLVEVEGSATR